MRKAIALCLGLAGCMPAGDPFETLPAGEAVLRGDQIGPGAPADARPEACYGRDVTPAVLETRTVTTLVTPAVLDANGAEISPASYATETRTEIVTPRQELWFETPCPEDLTPDFIASLQRALTVRGYYTGPVNGQADSATRSAVRAFQRDQGLDSAVLSVEAARQLGLVSYF